MPLNVGPSSAKILGVCCIALIAAAARGEWLLILSYIQRGYNLRFSFLDTNSNVTFPAESSILESCRLQNLSYFIVLSVIVSFTMFYGLAWGWQWHFYIKRRNQSDEWKCQPGKFLSDEDEKHEMILGSMNMFFGSILSGFISCYISNGGYTTLYFEVSERGWLYLLVSIPGLFMYIEVVSYYYHRTLHIPCLYKTIHKMHHRYHQPTAFSAVAMHPIEMLFHQLYLTSVPFIFPIHIAVYIPTLLYVYYYGMCDHSGIKMEAIWPWQPSTKYHDNHHKLFHVNFGLNTPMMDWLHGTMARPDRIYGENVFGGHGKHKE